MATPKQLLDTKFIFDESDYPEIRVVGEESTYLSYEGLTRMIFDDVDFFYETREGSYQGDWYMLGKGPSGWHLITSSFGSCSGCDMLEGTHTRKELEEVMDSIVSKMMIFGDVDELREKIKQFDFHDEYRNNEGERFVVAMFHAIDKQLAV